MRRAAFAIFATVAGLVGLLSFKTHSPSVVVPVAISTAGPDTSGSNPSGSDPTTGATTNPTTGSTTTPAPTAGSSSSSSTKTVTGSSVNTKWGPVQVQITVTAGKLTDVTAVVYPTTNRRDQEINATAIPALRKEALAAGSANIDTISGATYTSQGFVGSLQSALNAAGL